MSCFSCIRPVPLRHHHGTVCIRPQKPFNKLLCLRPGTVKGHLCKYPGLAVNLLHNGPALFCNPAPSLFHAVVLQALRCQPAAGNSIIHAPSAAAFSSCQTAVFPPKNAAIFSLIRDNLFLYAAGDIPRISPATALSSRNMVPRIKIHLLSPSRH